MTKGSFVLRLSPGNPNTRSHYEDSFVVGGRWEQDGGPEQTRSFARCFHRHVRVPFEGEFSVLDVGCALGDALPVWHQHCPKARLFGCDVAQVQIDRCIQRYGKYGQFFRASFEEIEGIWDVICCSNVLEHFEQHVEIAELLLTHCKMLYVVTPYAELRDGKPLTPTASFFHVATFYEDTFARLEQEDKATITTLVVECPGSRGGVNWKRELYWRIMKLLRGISPTPPPRQIIYTIRKYISEGPI